MATMIQLRLRIFFCMEMYIYFPALFSSSTNKNRSYFERQLEKIPSFRLNLKVLCASTEGASEKFWALNLCENSI